MAGRRAGLVAALGCLALAAPASAATVTCGQVITSSTTVSNNLSNCAGHGLVVGASNITIDLNSKTIDGTGSGYGVANTGGFDNVVVRRGSVQQFQYGVVATGQSGGRYELLGLLGNVSDGAHISGSSGVRLSRLVVSGSVNGLAVVSSPNIVVDRGDYSANSFAGVNTFNADDLRVTDARAATNGVVGVALQQGTDNAVVEWVDAVGNGTAEPNNCKCGIYVANGSGIALRDNDADGNGWYGIWAEANTPGLQILANNAHENGTDGILITTGDNPLLADNDTNGNGNLGINVVTAATNGGNNDASGNGDPAQCNPADFCE